MTTIIWIFLLLKIFMEFSLTKCDYTNSLKFTNLKCTIYRQDYVTVNECRLRAVNRSMSLVNINATLLQPWDNYWVHFKMYKKERLYQPFPLYADVDLCQYMQQSRGSVIVNLVSKSFFRYTNLNHTCPYEGTFLVKNMPINGDVIPSAFPAGEYRFDVLVKINQEPYGLMQFFFEAKDLSLQLRRNKKIL